MKPLEKKLTTYLEEVTGMAITVHSHDAGRLPYFLTRLYDLFDMTIGSVSYLAVFLKQEDEFKPAQFLKHLTQICDIPIESVCVVAESLPSYVRKRMIEKGISFVVPKVQMYLPGMGMELRSRSAGTKKRKADHLSPATQVALIHWLLGRFSEPVTPLQLSKQLFYSTMSMSRAFDELDGLEVGCVERKGRNRLLTFASEKRLVWDEVRPRLQNPVHSLQRIAQQDLRGNNTLAAGMSALSKHTMIGGPDLPEYAVSAAVWKKLEKEGVKTIPLEEQGTCVIQVWRYDPKVLELDGMVDPFSLYLCFQEEADERIQMALEEMMEKYL